MNLHEYQAKQVFASYGMPVPNNQVVESVDDVPAALEKLEGDRWVVKAQVHAGGRGKAGGVKLIDDAAAVSTTVSEMLGSQLVTYQTNEDGQPVNQVLIEQGIDIANELYVGMTLDRAQGRVTIMASTEGGVPHLSSSML